MSFNFTPGFGSAGPTLNARAAKIKNREVNWNYQKYAYFYLTTSDYKPPTVGEAKDSDSVFNLIPRKGFSVGIPPTGGHLSLYTTPEENARRFKKHITSATITLDGGGDIYNSFIREFEIEFKVYTLDDLNLVENDLFKLGAKATVHYGWKGSSLAGEKNTSTISIYNFGYSMDADGSFNCNVKGLEGDAFAGAARVGGTIKLTDDESKTLSEEGANPANLSMALIAKYKTAHGLSADDDASDSKVKKGSLIKKNHDGVDYYMLGIKEVGEGGWFDDPFRVAMVRLEDIVNLANRLSGDSEDKSFDFHTTHHTISPAKAKYGSADPRKFILPGAMADYGEEAEDIKKNAPGGNSIKDILVSITYLTKKFDALSTTVNEKQQPPIVSKLLKSIGADLKRLTGGLVDLQIVPLKPKDPDGTYEIFNNTEVQKLAPPNPFPFSAIGENSIVKEISIDTEFDMDTMLMMTVGNVKSGAFNLAPLKVAYPEIPKIDVDPKNEEGKEEAEKEEAPTKSGVGKDGIDDERASSIASGMAQALSDDADGTMVTIPLQIKLGIKIDGIEGINFLAPVTVDRLPDRYKDNCKFLVTALEHSFDGDGGWETDIKTAMKIGK